MSAWIMSARLLENIGLSVLVTWGSEGEYLDGGGGGGVWLVSDCVFFKLAINEKCEPINNFKNNNSLLY